MKIVSFFLVATILISGCVSNNYGEDSVKKVSFNTRDGVSIMANYWNSGREAVLLLHMMPSTKESWNGFAKSLFSEGFSVLAIDLRGHGESTESKDGSLDFTRFSDEEHHLSSLDVEAAVKFLKADNKSVRIIVGASIGANLALEHQANSIDIVKSVLLSAGLDYRGIKAEPYVSSLDASQGVLFVAGSGDGATETDARTLAKIIGDNAEVIILETSNHGTNLFKADTSLMQEIIGWIKK